MPYVPSARERRTAERLLKSRTPPARAYRGYREQVGFWLGSADLAIAFAGDVGEVRGARLYTSDLFQREYLVAYVETRWLHRIAPTCDAIASQVTPNGTATTLGTPPLVIVPEARAHARSESFRSILEHEFVHVNQMLTGNYLEPSGEPTADALFSNFFELTRVEYEANLLQLTRWPRLYPRKFGISLSHWCVLRGYTQSLEQTLLALAEKNLPPREVAGFLDGLPPRLSQEFARAGMDADLSSWFRDRWQKHLAVAIVQVMTQRPSVKENAAFQALGRWYKSGAPVP